MPAEVEENGKGHPDSAISRMRANILLLSMPVLFFLLLILVYTQRGRIDRFIRKRAIKFQNARKMHSALRKAEKIIDAEDFEEFYTIIFRTLQAYLGDAFQLHHAGITGDIIRNVLRSHCMKEDMAEKIKNIFTQCDMARYASFRFSRDDMKETLVMLKEVMKDR